MENPRIVLLRAVSTDEQAENDKESLKYQDRLNREHAARWHGVIVDDLLIDGKSRNYILWDDACRELEAFAQLNELIERKAFDILMCMDITRLGRTAALVTTIAALCERSGIRIYETSAPPASIDGPIGFDHRLLMLFKAGQSEHEVRKFAERASFGRQAQVKKGKHANRPPYGLKKAYRIKGDEVESYTVIDEEARPVIELFFDLYINHGLSQYQITREFNARKLLTPTGRQWDVKLIRIFLVNRWTYAGYVTWGRFSKHPEKAYRIKAEWPAIISEEMVRAAEVRMKEHAQKPKAAGRPHRFSMMMRCKQCGASMSTSEGKSKNGVTKVPGYICRMRCLKSYVRESVVIAALEEAIRYLQDYSRLDMLVGEMPPDEIDLDTLLDEARKSLESVNSERKRLTLAFTREAIELDEYEPLMADLKLRYAEIAARINELEDKIAATPTPEQRRQRLETIRDAGLDMLHHPDRAYANAWLRQHFIIYIDKNRVAQIHLY